MLTLLSISALLNGLLLQAVNLHNIRLNHLSLHCMTVVTKSPSKQAVLNAVIWMQDLIGLLSHQK